MSLPDGTKHNITSIKYVFGFLAIGYFVGWVLTPETLIAPQIGRWPGLADALIFAVAAYGVHSRKPVFWKLIPILLLAFNLIGFITAWLWVRSPPVPYPATPLWLGAVLYLAVTVAFLFWWRKQRNYFSG